MTEKIVRRQYENLLRSLTIGYFNWRNIPCAYTISPRYTAILQNSRIIFNPSKLLLTFPPFRFLLIVSVGRAERELSDTFSHRYRIKSPRFSLWRCAAASRVSRDSEASCRDATEPQQRSALRQPVSCPLIYGRWKMREMKRGTGRQQQQHQLQQQQQRSCLSLPLFYSKTELDSLSYFEDVE